ncbi:hypothetical protein ACQP1V_25710 [Microtetraspora malaysiensis]
MRDRAGATAAALSIAMPSVRYSSKQVTPLIAAITAAADAITRAL